MVVILSNPVESPIRIAGGITELVRGNELDLLEKLEPLVSHQSVLLDLGCVQRIDAAGIAVLISLYRCAQERGHEFSLSAVSTRVAEILALVGLDRILLSQNAVRTSHSGDCFQTSAA